MSKSLTLAAYEVELKAKEPIFSYHLCNQRAFTIAESTSIEQQCAVVIRPLKFVFLPTAYLSPMVKKLAAAYRSVGYFGVEDGDRKIILGYLQDEPGDYYALVYAEAPDEDNPERFKLEAVEHILKEVLTY